MFEDIAPGCWWRVPGSALDSAAYVWPAGTISSTNRVGVRDLIGQENGAVYDSTRERMLLWGGGHMAYAGNEVYAFSVRTLRWQRLNDPCLNTDPTGVLKSTGYYPDALGEPNPRQPRSNHTYQHLQYVPACDCLVTFGLTSCFPGGTADSIGLTLAFALDTLVWERWADAPTWGYDSTSVYDAATGMVYVRGDKGDRSLSQFDVNTNRWQRRGNGWMSPKLTAVLDPLRHRYIEIGEGGRPGIGRCVYWDLDSLNPRQGNVAAPTTGERRMQCAWSPGLAYIPGRDCVVAWAGEPQQGLSPFDVFVLNLATWHWQRVQPSPANVCVPPDTYSGSARGVHDRWQYLPEADVFLLVQGSTATEECVYIYRLDWASLRS